jgi:hypothetical protein
MNSVLFVPKEVHEGLLGEGGSSRVETLALLQAENSLHLHHIRLDFHKHADVQKRSLQGLNSGTRKNFLGPELEFRDTE